MLCPRLLSVILALISQAGSATPQETTIITNDTFFYGQSPSVYPSPKGTGAGDWAAAYSQAVALVAQMTIEEKCNLTVGVAASNGCAGNIPSIQRLGFPGLCLQDAGNGVRATDGVSSFPSGIHSGASWNADLVYQRGRALGGEFLAKGVNVALGPVIGPLGRIAEGGRNWEGFSSDPYLAGKLGAETIKGIQERGVMTSTKHFIGNEQETNRNPSADGSVQSVSSNIDDRTMHELYLWPFADAVHAGTSNLMCSYNRINNSYGCGNSKTLNGLLKTELGFQGFVLSDWGAQHGGFSTALAGLDMVMPSGNGFWDGGLLTEAVQNGSIPESRLDDMATRILAGWYKLGQNTTFQNPGAGMPASLDMPHKVTDARDPAAQLTTFQLAVEGHVLVKNTGSLPLKSPKLLSIFGYDAKAPVTFDIGLSWEYSLYSVDATLGQVLGGEVNISQIAMDGTLISGGGSGSNTPPYISSPFDALSQRAYQENSLLLWDFNNSAPSVNGASDACLVFINAFASEGLDRIGLHDDYSDALVNNVAESCNNTIVVIHNAGVRLVDQFIDNPNVTALIYAHLPGQDSGRAAVSLLYGDSNPSGKLCYTVPKNESDYGRLIGPDSPSGQYQMFPQSDFDENLFIDYRHFDAYNITPRYEFGFGLSYTTFSYSNLQIKQVSTNTQPYPTGPVMQGGQTDLWDVLYRVTADVKNSGSVLGAEVAQLYIGIAGSPAKQLRGFSKVAIGVGQTATVSFDLMRRDLSLWDVQAQSWKLQSGSYNIWVGSSSRTLPLASTLRI